MVGPIADTRQQRGGAIVPPLYFYERNDFMAEFTSSGIQTVAAGQNVPLISTAACGKPCIVHREGSGIVTLRGLTQQCKAKFRVSFGANIAIPTGGTVGAITAALAINGEPLSSATAIVTPAAVENYFNIFVSTFAEVPRGCCLTVAAKNTSAQAVSFANSNMIVERVS
jgi:hypothetical protein